MPRPCAVETHAGDYEKAVETLRDATALRRGGSRLMLLVNRLVVAQPATVKLHGTRPWHPKAVQTLFVATNVNLHGTRPWHPKSVPTLFVASNVNLHSAR